MLPECIEIFKDMLEQSDNPDSIILNNYIPADGSYLFISKSGEPPEPVEIKFDKKNQLLEQTNSKLFPDICFYDYYSRILDMNKPIDSSKKIMSNNYLSFVVKKEKLLKGEITEQVIDNYYNILSYPQKKYEKSKGKEIYEVFEKEYGVVDLEALERNKKWIKENINQLENLGVDLSEKTYLKIFFEENRQLYIQEGKRYFLPNLYNTNKYNIKINDTILGLPNDNMGANAKKPFLTIKSRKLPTSYMLNTEQAMLQKQFFDYLFNFAASGRYNVFVDFQEKTIDAYNNKELPNKFETGLFLRIQKEKNEAGIHYQDYIATYQFYDQKPLVYKNVLGIVNQKQPELQKIYKSYDNKIMRQGLINEIMFSNYLINNYFTPVDKLSLNNGYLKRNLIISRGAIFDWIYKDDVKIIRNLWDKVSLDLTKRAFLENHFTVGVRRFNLRWSIMEYFYGGKSMELTIKELGESLKEKINHSETQDMTNDEEYYFGVGQLIKYFISLNRSKETKQSLINPFLNAKSDQVLKERIKHLFKKYNYDINDINKRFNNLHAMVMVYQPKSNKVNEDAIIAGYACNSLIYLKEDK